MRASYPLLSHNFFIPRSPELRHFYRSRAGCSQKFIRPTRASHVAEAADRRLSSANLLALFTVFAEFPPVRDLATFLESVSSSPWSPKRVQSTVASSDAGSCRSCAPRGMSIRSNVSFSTAASMRSRTITLISTMGSFVSRPTPPIDRSRTRIDVGIWRGTAYVSGSDQSWAIRSRCSRCSRNFLQY